MRRIWGFNPIISLLLACAVWLAASAMIPIRYADAKAGSEQGIDAVFVMDVSYSMNETDKEGIAAEVVNMFMDMSDSERTRIGFVAYNDKIVASEPLTSLALPGQKEKLKRKVGSLRRYGYTDLGLGLKKGADIATGGTGKGGKPFIILLSDGGTDFGNTYTGRTVADSNKDVERVIHQAKTKGYPIYTVGLNHDGSVNEQQLEQIASETGGSSYMTSSAEDLPEIFNRIFADQIQSVLVPIAAVTATGGMQEVKVNLPNSSMSEANIILLSQNPLKESQIYYSSKNVRFFKSGKYTLMKIAEPKKGELLLKFRGTAGGVVKVNLLGSYNMKAGAELTSAEAIKGQPTAFASRLHSFQGKALADKDVYRNLEAELVIKDRKTNKEERVQMDNNGAGFTAEYQFRVSGAYDWKVVMNGPYFFRETAGSHLDITNKAPLATGLTSIEISKEDGEAKLDFSRYFTDPNGDELTYKIAAGKREDRIEARVDGTWLFLSPLRSGSAVLTVTATDPEGGTVTGDLNITITSVWDRYLIIGGCALAALIAAGVLFALLRPKPAFTGRLEGYFLNTASGNEVPVKYWPLTSLGKARRVSLQQLFARLDVNEPLPEAANIVFEAGKNGTLRVKHRTNCTVAKGRTPLKPNHTEILEYNDKLYITFEDGITEIELRFKAVKPGSVSYADPSALQAR
ncbi:VWA domain-containing protein [Paenibacillus apiarius]|uniref:VWA domain-containing protein n=1 Tax=Paenibacillus apiarius TaxID=46240 RepID=UPI00197E2178|nr:VWA domain-containing protein [Paenibacillus apiarius]MBN3524108.1 VWA domain-containing protein [Paenibacillus apiarius]